MLLLFSGWSSQSQLHNKHSARIFGEIKPSVWIIILSGTRMCLQRRLFKILWSISSSYHLPHGQEIGNCELVNCIITNSDKWNFRNYFNSRTKVATFTYQEFIVTVYVPEIHLKKTSRPIPHNFTHFECLSLPRYGQLRGCLLWQLKVYFSCGFTHKAISDQGNEGKEAISFLLEFRVERESEKDMEWSIFVSNIFPAFCYLECTEHNR